MEPILVHPVHEAMIALGYTSIGIFFSALTFIAGFLVGTQFNIRVERRENESSV
jgi:hypothetical protein